MSIFLSLAGLIALLLIAALFMRKNHYVRREIIIHAPRQKVFDFIRFLKNQEKFNKHAMKDASRKKQFTGTDGTVGFIYAWSGNKDAGEGEKEIMNIIEDEKVEMEIRFVKPMRATATVIMETESIAPGQTIVSWSNAGTVTYPLNLLIPMMERMLPKEMDESLGNLKAILETE